MSLTLDRMPEGWDETSVTYDKVVFPITSRYASEVVNLLGVQEGHRLLDVAAGSGAATLAAIEAGAQVVATDFAPKMIDRLRLRLAEAGVSDVEAMVMDGQDLKFADGTFDRAMSVFGVIFFPDRVKGMSEMRRVLKDGGRAAIASWSAGEKTWPLSVWGATLRELIPDLPQPPEPPAIFSLADPSKFEAEMKEAGFNDVQVTPVTLTFDAASAEAYWDDFHAASPVFITMMQILGDRIDEYKETIIGKFRERFGDGPVSAASEALVAVGTK